MSTANVIADTGIAAILDDVVAGGRLGFDDAVRLLESR